VDRRCGAAGRGPGVEGLIESDRAAAMGFRPCRGGGGRWGWGCGGGEGLGCAGDGLKLGVLGARSESGVDDALGGSLRQAEMVAVLSLDEGAGGEGVVAMPAELVTAVEEPRERCRWTFAR